MTSHYLHFQCENVLILPSRNFSVPHCSLYSQLLNIFSDIFVFINADINVCYSLNLLFTLNSLRFVSENMNPEQDPFVNLPKAAATYAVGGMSTHWTACTPREYKSERSALFSPEIWDSLYKEAEKLLNTNQNMFDDTKIDSFGGGAPGGIRHFIRNNLVRDVLRETYPDLKESTAMPQYLPLAGVRRQDAPEYITWSGANTVLGDVMLDELKVGDTFQLKVVNNR